MATSLINTECKRYGCMKNLLACYANCRYSTRCDDLRNEVINNTDQASSDINKYLSERGRSPVIIQLMKRGLKFSDAPPPDARPGSDKQLPAAIKGSTTEAPRIKTKIIHRPAQAPAPVNNSANLSTRGMTKNRKRRPKLRAALLGKSKESRVGVTTVKLGKTQGASYLEKPPVVSRKKRGAKQKPQSRKTKKMFGREGGSAEKLAPMTRNRKSDVMARRPKNEFSATATDKEQVLNQPAQNQDVSANSKPMMTRPARSKKKRSAAARGNSAERNGKVYIILEGKSANVVDEQGLMMHLFTNPSSGARYFEASEVQARVQIIKK
jgi:hypothetical protein